MHALLLTERFEMAPIFATPPIEAFSLMKMEQLDDKSPEIREHPPQDILEPKAVEPETDNRPEIEVEAKRHTDP
jgi:hypothetical protein